MADVEILARVERRRKWTAQEKAAMSVPTAPTFIPLGLLGGSSHREPARPMRAMRANDRGVGGIEIVLPNGTVRVITRPPNLADAINPAADRRPLGIPAFISCTNDYLARYAGRNDKP